MPSLKDLRSRIRSVKNTQQITKTMKMVAAAKVRRARLRCEEARPYAEKLNDVLVGLAKSTGDVGGPLLLSGYADVKTVRLVVVNADRGLCGGFNGNLAKEVIRKITKLQAEGKTVEVMTVGKKVKDILKIDHADLLVDHIEDSTKNISYDLATEIGHKVMSDFEAGECQEVILFYNKFVNMMTQEPSMQYLAPFKVDKVEEAFEVSASVEYEPEEEAILKVLLPRNVNVQILNAMLESNAAEQAARMTAMDSATTNAGDMISKLSLQYNRTRQAAITTELTEIVAGAEAL
jgi:F-type H+-transporting ATPase subunit gamma